MNGVGELCDASAGYVQVGHHAENRQPACENVVVGLVSFRH